VDLALRTQLDRSRRLGFLGPGPIEDHVRHAGAFVTALEAVNGLVIDLGAGGGVPGLVVATARPDLHLVLLDAMAKRCRFLEEAVKALGLDAEVVEARAESIGRSAWRGRASAVIARSFAAPAPTAECAAPLLAVGGHLVVSEPPNAVDRWPAEALVQLGLAPVARLGPGAGVRVLTQVGPCPAHYPRRVGVPAKRPLF